MRSMPSMAVKLKAASRRMAPRLTLKASRKLLHLQWTSLSRPTSSVCSGTLLTGQARPKTWLAQLKNDNGFGVDPEILAAAKESFASERVSDKQTIEAIKDVYGWKLPAQKHSNGTANGHKATTGTEHDGHYILDPHSAIGIAASLRSIAGDGKGAQHISLATAHPAKFSHAVELALKDQSGFSFETVLPEQFQGLEQKQKRVLDAKASWEGVREIVVKRVEEERSA
jgi:threonine synthase